MYFLGFQSFLCTNGTLERLRGWHLLLRFLVLHFARPCVLCLLPHCFVRQSQHGTALVLESFS